MAVYYHRREGGYGGCEDTWLCEAGGCHWNDRLLVSDQVVSYVEDDRVTGPGHTSRRCCAMGTHRLAPNIP